MTTGLRSIRVVAAAGAIRGVLVAAGMRAECALGRSGITRDKHEGDGATPIGAHRLVGVLYRPDRIPRPVTGLPAAPIRQDDGWCDDPESRRYNRPVRLPYAASHEQLWRDDHLYDIVVVLDYNLAYPIQRRGSAIFLHLATPGLFPTAGCVAVNLETMRRLLAFADQTTVLQVVKYPCDGPPMSFKDFLLTMPPGIDFERLDDNRRNEVRDHRDVWMEDW